MTVVFTDIVGSTDLLSRMGDLRWRETLEAHRALVRRELRRFGGREVDTSGDGFFATFDQPANAVRFALASAEEVHELGLSIRAGIHTSEIEISPSDVAGIGVHTGARIAALAEPDEVLVSATTRDLVAGAGFTFADRGTHPLKGVEGGWHLFAAGAPTAAQVEPVAPAKRRTGFLVASAVLVLVAAIAGVTVALSTRGSGTSPRRSGGHPSTVAVIPAGSGQIESVALSGGSPRAIGEPIPGLASAELSPDGRRFALASGRQIATMNTDGSGLTRLTHEVDGSPTWSPDGTMIAFSRKTQAGRRIMVMSGTGAAQRALTAGTDTDTHPAWSPDGRWIAFSRKTLGSAELWAVRLDGSKHALEARANDDDEEPAWFPGRSIVFVRTVEGRGMVFRLHDTGAPTLLGPVGPSAPDVTDPTWSPDRRWIAFSMRDATGWHVWVMAADGSGARQLTFGRSADRSPSWSSDGATIYFARGSGEPS